jgi:hypothetical protein
VTPAKSNVTAFACAGTSFCLATDFAGAVLVAPRLTTARPAWQVVTTLG